MQTASAAGNVMEPSAATRFAANDAASIITGSAATIRCCSPLFIKFLGF
jgi:hypothetical protein